MIAPNTPAHNHIYTFYNEASGCYLSYQGNRLLLRNVPSKWVLKDAAGKGFHIYADHSDFLLDIDNAYVAEGTAIKLWGYTGYDVQVWKLSRNGNGTWSILYSGNPQYCLGFRNGNAILQLRNLYNKAQEWKVVDITDTQPKEYLSFQSRRGIVELQLPPDILRVISNLRLQQWTNDLETAYYSFYELTGFVPYRNITVEAYKPLKYQNIVAYVLDRSNIIHIDKQFVYEDLAKMKARKCDWNFCTLHEMGHLFDNNRPWNFEAELLTDLKLAYVLEKHGAAAAPSQFRASDVFYGAGILNAYKILGKDFSVHYDIFGCTGRFLEIKNRIGWKPYQQTFHYLQKNETAYQSISKPEKFEFFIKLLSYYSNNNIKQYFSANEWNAILRHTKS